MTQAFAPDAGNSNGFVLSNGAAGTMPARTGTNTGVQAGYLWADLALTPHRGNVWYSGSYIARLEF